MMPRPDIETIRARITQLEPDYDIDYNGNRYAVGTYGRQEVDAILNDIPALLAYVAELEQIAAKVATAEPYYSEQPEGWYCTMCDARLDYIFGETNAQASKRFPHEADCPITLSRNALTNQASRTLD